MNSLELMDLYDAVGTAVQAAMSEKTPSRKIPVFFRTLHELGLTVIPAAIPFAPPARLTPSLFNEIDDGPADDPMGGRVSGGAV